MTSAIQNPVSLKFLTCFLLNAGTAFEKIQSKAQGMWKSFEVQATVFKFDKDGTSDKVKDLRSMTYVFYCGTKIRVNDKEEIVRDLSKVTNGTAYYHIRLNASYSLSVNGEVTKYTVHSEDVNYASSRECKRIKGEK